MFALACGAVSARAGHVNLWPLYCQDDDGVSIAWPLVSFKNASYWRVGTFFCDYGEWGAWPLFMDYSDQLVVLPFVIAKDFGGGAVLPLAYADWKGSHTFSTVFPLYYRDANDEGDSLFWAVAGLAGWTAKNHKLDSHWLLPLWIRSVSGRSAVLLAGLAGWDYGDDSDKTDWLFPFWIRGKDFFWSIPWYCGYDGKGAVDEWFSLPLLSWCKGDEMHITPLAGWTDHAHWFAPFYYWNDSGIFCTALYGRTKTSSWLLPFYHKDEDGLRTLLLYYRDADNFLSPLYSRIDGKNVFLLGMAGFDRSSKHPEDWILPLWYRNGKIFASIPYGSVKRERELGSSTVEWWGLPLFTTESGCTSGFGIHPVVACSRDNILDTLETLSNAERLDGMPLKDIVAKGRVYAKESLEWLFGLAGSEHSILLSASNIPSFSFDGEGGLVKGNGGGGLTICEEFETGNIVFLKSYRRRYVSFDSSTLERTTEREWGYSHFLGIIWDKTWSKERGKYEEYEASLLWRLWHSKSKDGNTTTDVFPFLSFERRADGYSKTSFLWRFYRNEKKADGTREVDFLFLPVWR